MTSARSGAGEAGPALVNGAAGVVFAARGRPFSVVGFTIRRGRIVEIDVLADPARIERLYVDVLDDDRAAESLGGNRADSGPAPPEHAEQ